MTEFFQTLDALSCCVYALVLVFIVFSVRYLAGGRVFAVALGGRRHRRITQRFWYLLLFVGILAYVAAIRKVDITGESGIGGTDIWAYYAEMRSWSSVGFLEFMERYVRFSYREPFYFLSNWILGKLFCGDFFLYSFTIYCVVCSGFAYYTLRHYRGRGDGYLLVVFWLSFLCSLNTVRQMVSCSVALFGLELLQDKKRLSSFMLFAAAACYHYSSAIFLLFWLFSLAMERRTPHNAVLWSSVLLCNALAIVVCKTPLLEMTVGKIEQLWKLMQYIAMDETLTVGYWPYVLLCLFGVLYYSDYRKRYPKDGVSLDFMLFFSYLFLFIVFLGAARLYYSFLPVIAVFLNLLHSDSGARIGLPKPSLSAVRAHPVAFAAWLFFWGFVIVISLKGFYDRVLLSNIMTYRFGFDGIILS